MTLFIFVYIDRSFQKWKDLDCLQFLVRLYFRVKKYLLIPGLFLVFFNTNVFARTCVKSADTTIKTLPDGHYYGNVDYFNYASSISATYSDLKLKVREGIVRVIYLSNGGIIHDGINNEGYLYTGGKLKASKDKHTGKLEYTAQVSISNGVNIYSYKITITREAADDQ